jgi:hypothetical protein
METVEMKVDDLEAALPDEFLPTLEKPDKEVIMDKVDKDKGRKKKAWGPVQATRQSSRVDTSINVMKKAIEYKKRSNLEEPNKKMKGIMQSNVFQSLDVDYLESLARKVGVDISAISANGRVESNHHSFNSPRSVLVDIEIPSENLPLESQKIVLFSDSDALAVTPGKSDREGDENYEDEGDKWIEVIRKSRGKHPKKRLQC